PRKPDGLPCRLCPGRTGPRSVCRCRWPQPVFLFRPVRSAGRLGNGSRCACPRHRRHQPMTPANDDRSFAALISDLVQQLSTLVQTEGRLLRSELTQGAHKAGAGAMEIAAGAILLLAALIVLLQALIVALANLGLGAGWSSLLVGI